MLAIHFQGHRRSRGRYRPAGFHGESLRVHNGHVIFLFVVVVEHALAVGHGLFDRATHVDGLHYSLLDRIDNRGILAVAIKGKHKLGRGIVGDGVRVWIAFDLIRDLQGFKIEHRHAFAIAIGDESLAQLRKDDDAVAALQARYGAHDGKSISVEYFHFGAMREIHAPRSGVYGDVVEIFSAAGCRAQRDFFNQVITRRGRTRQSNGAKQCKRNKPQQK